MIYIDKSKTAVQVYIPINGSSETFSTAVLVLTSTADRTTLTLPVSTPSVVPTAGGPLYLKGIVSVPEALFLGEWEYKLKTSALGEDVFGVGLLVVTEDGEPVGVKEYNADITYKQYGE